MDSCLGRQQHGCSQCSREKVREGSSQWVPALSTADGLWEPLDCQKSKFRSDPSCGCAHALEVVREGCRQCSKVAASCSAGSVPGAGGGIDARGDSSRGTNGASCCSQATTEPAQPIRITVCAGRWSGGSGGGTGLSGERFGRELAEWHSQGSELAEWRSQARELAERAAGCRTMKSGCRTGKSGCRTVPTQAVCISTYWELWLSPERGCSPVERLYIASPASDSQCSLFLCSNRKLLQRSSQGAVLAMGQWAGL